MPRDYAKSSRASRETGRSGPPGFVWLLVGILVGLIIAGIFYLKNQSPHGSTLPTATRPQTTTITKTPAAPQHASSSAATQNLQTQFDFYNVLPSQKVVGPSGDEDTSVINNQNATPPPASTSTAPTTTTTQPSNNTATNTTNNNLTNTNGTTVTTTNSTTPTDATSLPTTPKTANAPTEPTNPQPAATTSEQSSSKVPTETTSPSVSTNKATDYIVQIATYSNFTEVDQLKAQLSLLGFEVNVSPVQKSGKTLQRVWLGPYHTMSEAQDMQKQLQDNQISSKVLKSG